MDSKIKNSINFICNHFINFVFISTKPGPTVYMYVVISQVFIYKKCKFVCKYLLNALTTAVVNVNVVDVVNYDCNLVHLVQRTIIFCFIL